MHYPYTKSLKEIKDKLTAQNISVLVGAGFSLNVSKEHFKSWRDLLKEMVLKMYGKTYKAEFEQLKKKEVEDDDKELVKYAETKAYQYIEDLGYLKVVSVYMERMGYRETVDKCIEEATPKLVREKDGIYLQRSINGKTEKHPIEEKDLLLHEQLVKLPWVNIFTTNYDNLLESCINEEIKAALTNRVRDNSVKLSTLNEQHRSIQIQIENQIDELQFLSAKKDGALTPQEKSERDRLAKEEQQFQQKLQVLEKKIKGLEIDQNALDGRLQDCYEIITHSSGLAIKRNKNIIKLHGSLPMDDEDDNFSFDNDYSKRYVITEEDYKSYPQKHEAFTQLMRISLLQGHFCLFGFSGDDPNFHAWINWVRTVIQRNPNTKRDQKKTKIYLIDARASADADSHKLQFYRNHSIAYIPLAHPDCIAFLEKQTGQAIHTQDTKALLAALLKFLSETTAVDTAQLLYEILAKQEYEQFASMIPEWQYGSDLKDLQMLSSQFQKVKGLKKFNALPTLDHYQYAQKAELIQHCENHLKIAESDSETLGVILDIIVTTIEELHVPYTLLLTSDRYAHLVRLAEKYDKHLQYRFQRLQLKHAIWKSNETEFQKLCSDIAAKHPEYFKQDKQVLEVMSAAMSLDFTKLRSLMTDLDPNNNYFLTLIGYLSNFDVNAAKEKLNFYVPATIQEQLNALELQKRINYFIGDNDDLLRKLKHEGLKTISDVQQGLVEIVGKTSQKIKPFEFDDSLHKSITFAGSDKLIRSFQYFGLSMETGTQITTGMVNFQNKEDLFPLLMNVYDRYPLLILYYTFQYNDKDIITRLAQTYSYNEVLDEEKHKIFGVLSKAFLSNQTPERYRSNALVFLTEFIKIIDPKEWEPFFLSVWQVKRDNKALFIEWHRKKDKFIETAIRYCQDATVISEILNDTLEAALGMGSPGLKTSEPLDTAIDYLYFVAQNPFRKELKDAIRQDLNSDLINGTIKMIHEHTKFLLLLGNIHWLLEEDEQQLIYSHILKMDFTVITERAVWGPITHFAGQDKKLLRAVVKAIIASPRLWDTGIVAIEEGKTGFNGERNFIRLRGLRKGEDSSFGLSFTKTEAVAIFKKIPEKLKQIENNTFELFSDFSYLLQEMKWFLEDEHASLSNQERYDETLLQVNQRLSTTVSELDVLGNLASTDPKLVNHAVTEIARVMYDQKDFPKVDSYIKFIISKLQLKANNGLSLCLSYLSTWVFHFREREEMKAYGASLVELLKLYYNAYPENIIKPKIESMLVKIAAVLKFWGYNEPIIDSYLQLLQTSRFIDVRHNLKAKLSRDLADTIMV